MNKLKKYYDKFKYRLTHNLKTHLSDSTAILIESTPLFAAVEINLYHMSNDVSQNARLIVATGTIAGFGWLYGKGRDVWKDKFHITHDTKEKIKSYHDLAYAFTFNLLVSPFIYYFSGSDNIKQIAIGTLGGAVSGALNGVLLGPTIDSYRYLTGIGKTYSKYYPDFLKRQSPKVKKFIAAGLLAASIGLTYLVYHPFNSTKLKTEQKYETQSLENILTLDSQNKITYFLQNNYLLK
ncbi:MAG: hypothetical protein WC755_05255 [Candidatus Woesearchaeota archaeon]|jgi:hypothetical protein